jgi:DNA-binding CsgD family transcriptional regulator
MLAFPRAGPARGLYWRADHPRVFAHLEDSYLKGAYLLDPFYELSMRRVPAGVYRLREVAPDQFTRTRYYRDYYRRTTIIDELDCIAYPAEGLAVNVSLGRDAASGAPFSGRDLAAAARIAPVIVALAEAHWAGAAPAPAREAEADLPAALADALARTRDVRITRRQAEVALLILRGHSSGAIALRLGVSAQTVKVFRRQLYARCGLSSQAELFALLTPLLGPGA